MARKKQQRFDRLSVLRQHRAVFYDFVDKKITCQKPYLIAKMGIGLIPQGRNNFPSLSVKENLPMAARSKGSQSEWILDKVYSQFPILKERSNLKGTLLSGGEQQTLAIGRGLMTNPDLLLMDEPSEGLSSSVVRKIGSIITQLENEGRSILLAEKKSPWHWKFQIMFLF